MKTEVAYCMDKNEKFELIRAEEKDSKYSNPKLRLILTIGYLGIFGSIITVFMIFMSALSRENHEFDVKYTAAGIVVMMVCTAAVVVLNIQDKKAKKEFFKNENILRKNAQKYRGKIVGAEKNIRHVTYMKEVFDETIWNFIIKYKDENNEIITVKSEKFLNDISEVLASKNVTVYALEDGTFEFGKYKLRENKDDDFVKLKIKINEEDAKV